MNVRFLKGNNREILLIYNLDDQESNLKLTSTAIKKAQRVEGS